jgi:hypothetical protein
LLRIRVGIHPPDSGVRPRHLLFATFKRVLFGSGNFLDYASLGFLENRSRHTVTFEILLVHPDRIASSPVFEDLRSEDPPGLSFIMGRVAAHPECLGVNNGGAAAVADEGGSEFRGRIGIEDVVAVAGKSGDTVSFAPGCQGTALVLIEASTESDLIILEHEDSGHMEDGSQIQALVKGRCFGCSIADPRQRDSRFLALFEREGDPRKHRNKGGNLAGGRDHACRQIAHMKIRALARRVGCRQIFAKHVCDRYPHFMARAGVSDHRPDLVYISIQRVHVSDGHGFLAGAEPGLGKDALFHPSPEGDVVHPEPEHPGIHVQKLRPAQV